jgi:hypothetical protein
MRNSRVSAIRACGVSGNYDTDHGRIAVLPWSIDLRGILHVHECNLRGDTDMPIGDMHSRANMRGFGGNVFAKSDLCLLSVVYWNGDMRTAGNVHRTVHVSRNRNLSGCADVRSAADLPTGH